MDKESPALTRAAILGCEDTPRKRVDVPEWGGHVHVRPMTAGERDEFEQRAYGEGKASKEFRMRSKRAFLVAICTVDETGKRLFDVSDIEGLAARNAAAMDRVVAEIYAMNALSPADIEALRKN